MEEFVVNYLFELGFTFICLVGVLAILIKNRVQKNVELERKFPAIDMLGCVGCRLCVKKCPTGALSVENKVAVLASPEKCTGCGACALSCKKEVIEMIEWAKLKQKNPKAPRPLPDVVA